MSNRGLLHDSRMPPVLTLLAFWSSGVNSKNSYSSSSREAVVLSMWFLSQLYTSVIYIFFFYSRLNNWAFTTVNLKLGLPYRNEDILYGVHLPCLEITEEWLVLCLHFTVPESQDWTAISKRGHLYGAISWEIWRSICSLFLYLSL